MTIRLSSPRVPVSLFLGLVLIVQLAAPLSAQPRDFITIASTTSTQNSGLFSHILPKFTAKTGVDVRVVAVGTGQAIRIARRGDADVLFVHHRASEDAFVGDGFGVARYDVMYNDFIIVGPQSDPAEIKGVTNAGQALSKLARSAAVFISRADNSGTHKKEMELWNAAGVDPSKASGSWYLETGLGMGAALNVAAGKGAYILTDRGTWLSFDNKGDLETLVEGDARLFNPYGVILVNPKRHPHVNAKAGQLFVDWITSPEGQAAIASYRRNGKQLFYPNSHAANAGSKRKTGTQ